ncbi:MAG TPA: CPBP family intramembrane glutamic endopeptidase [Gaiellaceae bacterium]|nr:CPBP family intramembrane glutamic endopeptidase [Gaiellaceae bacterium]
MRAGTSPRWQRALPCAAYLAAAVPLVRLAYGTLRVPVVGNAAPWLGVPVAAALLLATSALLRRERRSPSELGLRLSRRAATHLTCGLAAGLLLLGAGALLLRLVLPFTWRVNPSLLPAVALGSLLFGVITATCEELAWRGYAFDGLLRLYGVWPAQVVVALVAAYFHVLSGWSWAVALTSTIAGSVLFGLVFLRWRSVPAAVGVHAGWNWGRDLGLSPGSAGSVWLPEGMQRWTPTQWSVAQAVLIALTLVACAWLIASRRIVEGAASEPPNESL